MALRRALLPLTRGQAPRLRVAAGGAASLLAPPRAAPQPHAGYVSLALCAAAASGLYIQRRRGVAMAAIAADDDKLVVVAVSGTLQEGFPLRRNLNYYNVETGELIYEAVFLGWALCRGMKSYFDVKDRGCREYVEPSVGATRVNPAIVPTGDPKDANVYAVYLVHEKAALNALLNEPRLLSMSPDAAKVDLTAEETSDSCRQLFGAAIEEAGAANKKEISLLTVVSTVRAPTFVENPVLYTKDDGTRVTNFHDGLAKLAGTTDKARLSDPKGYAAAVETTLRRLEAQQSWSTVHGVDGKTMRFIQKFSKAQWAELQAKAAAFKA